VLADPDDTFLRELCEYHVSGQLKVAPEHVSDPVLQKMGFLTVDALKKLSAGKLFNDLCGYNKKNKLGLKNPTADEVKTWVE